MERYSPGQHGHIIESTKSVVKVSLLIMPLFLICIIVGGAVMLWALYGNFSTAEGSPLGLFAFGCLSLVVGFLFLFFICIKPMLMVRKFNKRISAVIENGQVTEGTVKSLGGQSFKVRKGGRISFGPGPGPSIAGGGKEVAGYHTISYTFVDEKNKKRKDIAILQEIPINRFPNKGDKVKIVFNRNKAYLLNIPEKPKRRRKQ